MLDLPHLLPSAVLLLVALYRIKVLRRPGTQRALWFALLFLAGGETLRTEPIWRAATAHLGVAGAAVAKQTSTIGAAAAVLVLQRGLTGAQGGSRRLAVATAAALLGMSVPLLMSHPTTSPQRLTQQAEVYTSSWGWLTHWVAVLLYLSWTLVSSIRISAHYSRRAAPGALRTGLRLVGAAAAVGLMIVALKVAVLVAGLVHQDSIFAFTGPATESVLMACSLLLVAAGTGYEVLARLGHWWRDHWTAQMSLRRLRPLWQAVYAAVPYIALSAGAMNTLLGARFGAQDRLYRRVVEIHDGLLALGPYATPGMRERALTAAASAGVSGTQAEAVAEAVWLKVAVAAKTRGQAVARSRTVQQHMPGGHNLPEAVRWLEQVAAAYTHNPLVERLASDLHAADAAGMRAV